MENNKVIAFTGLAGLAAAILVGVGEFLLHFDPLARFSATSYEFMLAPSEGQQTMGHFFGALGAPLYLLGCWHIYLMLKPANKVMALIAFLVGAYGFVIGGQWIASRASIAAIMHLQGTTSGLEHLVTLYQLRYENLLTVVRVTTVVLSGIFICLTLTGNSLYQRWQAVFSPIFLLLLSFVVFVVSPQVGKYLMPIALNVGFGLFFIMSLIQAQTISPVNNNKVETP